MKSWIAPAAFILSFLVTLAMLLVSGALGQDVPLPDAQPTIEQNVAGELARVPEWQMAAACVILGLLHLVAVRYAWRVKRMLSRLFA